MYLRALGENPAALDSAGMNVFAIYKNGEIKQVTDYELKNWINLKSNQKSGVQGMAVPSSDA